MDANTGKQVYISETGGIAVPAAVQSPSTGKAPGWKYGLDLRVRRAGEVEFTGSANAMASKCSSMRTPPA